MCLVPKELTPTSFKVGSVSSMPTIGKNSPMTMLLNPLSRIPRLLINLKTSIVKLMKKLGPKSLPGRRQRSACLVKDCQNSKLTCASEDISLYNALWYLTWFNNLSNQKLNQTSNSLLLILNKAGFKLFLTKWQPFVQFSDPHCNEVSKIETTCD